MLPFCPFPALCGPLRPSAALCGPLRPASALIRKNRRHHPAQQHNTAGRVPVLHREGDVSFGRKHTQGAIIDKINQGRLGKVYFAARGRDTREWMMTREQLI